MNTLSKISSSTSLITLVTVYHANLKQKTRNLNYSKISPCGNDHTRLIILAKFFRGTKNNKMIREEILLKRRKKRLRIKISYPDSTTQKSYKSKINKLSPRTS